MKYCIFCFSDQGAKLAERLCGLLETEKKSVHTIERFAAVYGFTSHISISEDMGKLFDENDALIFIGACGIAVREISPFIKSKITDPAVLVIDDRGRFVIPVLSGHIGGANRLARDIAGVIGAEPVITTSTDGAGRFSCDEWAARNGLVISSMKIAKEISAAVLEEDIPVFSEYGLPRVLPPGLVRCEDDTDKKLQRQTPSCDCGLIRREDDTDKKLQRQTSSCDCGLIRREDDTDKKLQRQTSSCDCGLVRWEDDSDIKNHDGKCGEDKKEISRVGEKGIYIGVHTVSPFEKTLRLIPRTLTIGIGCRLGIAKEQLEEAIRRVFAENDLDIRAVEKIASIDVKKNEEGLLDLAKEKGLQIVFYSAGELNCVQGDFEESAFVKETVGTGNVCERAAALKGGKIIVKKTAVNGVTVAVAEKEWRSVF